MIGRPKIEIDESKFRTLKAEGKSYSELATEFDCGYATIFRIAKKLKLTGSKINPIKVSKGGRPPFVNNF